MPDPVPNPIAAQVIQPNPSVQVMGGGAGLPNPTPDMPAQQQMAAVSGPAPTVAQAHPAWHNFVNAMTGSQAEYQQTPDGPVLKPQSRAQKLFGGILTGAMMGLGAGGDASNTSKGGSPYARASQGVQDVQKSLQEQQDQKQKAAQQQWENQRQANEDRQKAASANTEEQLKRASIAQANAETLRTNIMTQGASYDLHQKIADADKARVSTFEDAGVKPVYKDITESQMNDYLKNNPGASSLDWRHTGVTTTLTKDANGNDVPNYEYTLSAYDPNAKVPLSAATVKQWKEDGLFKYHPEYEDIAVPGKTLSVDQFTALDKQSQNFYNQDLAKNKTKLENDHLQAQIDEAHSAIREHNAQAAHENLSTQELKEEKTRKDAEDTAWDHLSKVGNDPDKLTDPHDRAVLAQSVRPLMQETLTGIKTAATEAQAGDKSAEAELPDLWQKYNTYSKLASLSPAQVAQPVTVTLANGQTGVIPSDKVNEFLKANPGAKKAVPGASVSAAKPVATLNPMGQGVVNAVKTAVPYVQQAISQIP